jgi:hypothetical protein
MIIARSTSPACARCVGEDARRLVHHREHETRLDLVVVEAFLRAFLRARRSAPARIRVDGLVDALLLPVLVAVEPLPVLLAEAVRAAERLQGR